MGVLMPETRDGTQQLPKKPTPSHKGRRGCLGVLMPETRDGTQQLPKKPTPSHKGRRRSLGVLMPETRDGTQQLPKKPTPSHKGRRRSLGVLMPETRDGTQQLPKKPTPSHKGLRADRTFEQRHAFHHCNAQSAILSASTRRIGRGEFQTCPLRRSDAARNVYRTYFLSALEPQGEKGDSGRPDA
jgi:hypothetical protein